MYFVLCKYYLIPPARLPEPDRRDNLNFLSNRDFPNWESFFYRLSLALLLVVVLLLTTGFLYLISH